VHTGVRGGVGRRKRRLWEPHLEEESYGQPRRSGPSVRARVLRHFCSFQGRGLHMVDAGLNLVRFSLRFIIGSSPFLGQHPYLHRQLDYGAETAHHGGM
jgi:hypothetical protein